MPKSSSGIDFYSMERSTRTFALVGNYLQWWALMELDLDDAIAKALGLTGLQQHVLRSNLQFHSKIHVMGALLHLSALEENEKAHYSDVLNKMGSYSADRNTLAHNLFASSKKTDGVEF